MEDRSTLSSSNRPNPLVSFLVVLTLCYAVAFVGTEGSLRGVGDWYFALKKPSWNPPAWVFAPVWTLLYGMMGVAAWIVYSARASREGERKGFDVSRRRGLFCFAFQLALNAGWSWIFFAAHLLAISVFEILILWLCILATVVLFQRTRPAAAWLLLPYLGWVTFASLLNFAIFRMNR